MAVSQEISAAIMQEELSHARDLAHTYKWGLIPNFKDLSLLTTMYSHTGDLFILDIRFDDYKEKPPLFELIDAETGDRGTLHAYPKTNDSLFHTSGPCICAPFNRKAYKKLYDTGPHEDWNLGDWMTSNANGTNWVNFSKIGDMLGLIQTRLSQSELYKGRLG